MIFASFALTFYLRKSYMSIIMETLFFNEYLLLAIVAVVLISVSVVFNKLQRNIQQIMIDLTDRSNVFYKVFSLGPYILLMLSFLLIPQKYVFITILIVLAMFAMNIYMQKYLVIETKGVRCTCRWRLKWDNIKSYQLDKEKGILNIQTKDGNRDMQISGIAERYYSVILSNMDNYLHST